MVYDIDLLVLHWRSDNLGDEMSVYRSRVVDGKYKQLAFMNNTFGEEYENYDLSINYNFQFIKSSDEYEFVLAITSRIDPNFFYM
eukprot:CAMPEP_0176348848 /NCGR_PEP_ID=MMETSP0126-20121128/8203_1 /TAXON_ID=141414 ORGANISM="Strombidinopsis acuminatum, Strain SPMC142" /NCGR_SAMPLE_ID=MMETSP0126 /ASSEMBLY_ACC=CAM_ASM_000229 /LENGTH=84 /DNA_ID=CAMNT_0017697905 /DNA_START=569 /DNA_END=823 /DNA_ORIENTATION=-